MRSQTSVPHFLVPALCLAAAALGALPAQAADCPTSVKDAAQVSITIDYEKNSITASPDPVTIYMNPKTGQPAVVCWVVKNNDSMGPKQTVKIEAKADQPAMFTTSEFSMTKSSYYADSGKPTAGGSWSYWVKLFEGDAKEPKMTLDPQVVVDMGSGSGGG